MRTPLVFLAILPMLALAACDSSPPPAQTSKPAVTAPVAPTAKPAATTPAATASLPAAARPMLGTWAEALENCGAAATVSISASTYTSAARTCAMNVRAEGDGFALDCGGTAMTLVPVFAPSGEGIRVSVGGGKPTTLLRCTK